MFSSVCFLSLLFSIIAVIFSLANAFYEVAVPMGWDREEANPNQTQWVSQSTQSQHNLISKWFPTKVQLSLNRTSRLKIECVDSGRLTWVRLRNFKAFQDNIFHNQNYHKGFMYRDIIKIFYTFLSLGSY